MSDVDVSKEDKDRKRDRQAELIKYGFLPILYTFAFFNALSKRMPMHWTINQVAHVFCQYFIILVIDIKNYLDT